MSTLEMMLDKLGGMDTRLQRMEEQQQIEQVRLQERLRGKKRMKFKLLATAANPFTMGGDAAVGSGGILVGPDAGFRWGVRALLVEGLATGATPDVVKLRVGNAQGRLLWQLNGNSYGTTFGGDEMPLDEGEFIFVQSVGTFNATGTITLWGWADQVPGPLAGEFF